MSMHNRCNSSSNAWGQIFIGSGIACRRGAIFRRRLKGVAIPKKSGGERILGIPTVSDRVAQTVVKMVFEPLVEPIFHENSYGYRPGRSAHDALAIVRRRCWEYDWVIEFDIKGLFDHIDHELLMRAVRHHCQIPWVVLYIERWLKAPMVGADGETQQRDKGTPQGGVISPVLANLFLHYTLDRWIRHHLCSVRLCRYADDGVIHCKSERQAHWVLAQISERLAACGLQIHPEKTRIVYCKDVNRREEHENIEFTFLGYSFRPRKAVDKYGRVYPNFSPAASPVVLKNMRQTIRSWHLQLKCDKSLHDLFAYVQSSAAGLVAILRSIQSLRVAPDRDTSGWLPGPLADAKIQVFCRS